MPEFAITTTSGAVHAEGQWAHLVPSLATIGADTERLDRFSYEADYVVLHYGGYTLSIPEASVEHIAERDRDSA